MRTCETCKFYVAGIGAVYDKCTNPALPGIQVAKRQNELLTLIREEMREKPSSIFCEYARGYEDECGREGKFWEKADVPF